MKILSILLIVMYIFMKMILKIEKFVIIIKIYLING